MSECLITMQLGKHQHFSVVQLDERSNGKYYLESRIETMDRDASLETVEERPPLASELVNGK